MMSISERERQTLESIENGLIQRGQLILDRFWRPADLAEYDHVRSLAGPRPGPAVLSGSLHPIRAQLVRNDCYNINPLG